MFIDIVPSVGNIDDDTFKWLVASKTADADRLYLICCEFETVMIHMTHKNNTKALGMVCSTHKRDSCKIFNVNTMALYNVLGVEQNASAAIIKQAYHKMVLQYHPDRNHQKEKQTKDNMSFLQIQEAWELLRDGDKRRLYDEELNKLKLKESNVSISYHATLNDLELIDDEKDENGKIINFYEYPCRCGDYFEIEISANSINTDKSNSKSVITSCPTCCLNLKLLY